MYEALTAAALSPEDPEHVVETVSRVRRDHPRLSREELACKLTSRAALTCAVVGATGGYTAFQALAFDRMLLAIARVSGRPASSVERAAAAAASVLTAGAAEGARRQLLRASRRLPDHRSPLLPAIAGVFAGGAIAYGAAQLLGLAARRYVFGGKRLR
jgi:hypothetical protein